jgi:thiol:disulfide interchange protein DsbC
MITPIDELNAARAAEAAERPKQTTGWRAWTGIAVSALALGVGLGALSNAAHGTPIFGGADTTKVKQALTARLPKTKVTSINCTGFGGMCEVVAGTTLFYVDPAARYLMIGRLYDMETRADVTAARLLELNPQALVAGAAKADNPDAQGEHQAGQPSPAAKVDLAELPKGGAIHWGPETGPRLVVLSDFACSYCRKLSAELKRGGFRVEERPISIFGEASRHAAERVLCAPDPVAALHAAYVTNTIAAPRKCDTTGLNANEAFAKRHAFGGTPVVIRADGTVAEGYRTAEQLHAFVKGNKS